MSYVLHLLILLCIYGLLSVSLDLLVGHTGLLSVAHAAFFGLGAYTGALVAIQLSLAFGWQLIAAVLAAAGLGIVVGLPSARLSREFFLLATLAFQVVFVGVLRNVRSVTRGPIGLGPVPVGTVFGLPIASAPSMLIAAGLTTAVGLVIADLLVRSPYGRTLHAVREDEVLARSLGKDTFTLKLSCFGVAAGLAGAAGLLYAHQLGFIEPDVFGIDQSILVLTMVIMGGPASRLGPLLGAALLLLLPELLRFVGLPDAFAAHFRQVLYGLLLLGVVALRPAGLGGASPRHV